MYEAIEYDPTEKIVEDIKKLDEMRNISLSSLEKILN